jgi:hypothetical protein
MNKTKITLVALSVAALGAAGAGTAFASTHSPAVRPVHAQVVQVPAEAPGTETADGPGGPDVQQGDQNAPDTASSADQSNTAKGSADQTSTESAGSEKAGASDGPGGYADPAGNADTQQEGEH